MKHINGQEPILWLYPFCVIHKSIWMWSKKIPHMSHNHNVFIHYLPNFLLRLFLPRSFLHSRFAWATRVIPFSFFELGLISFILRIRIMCTCFLLPEGNLSKISEINPTTYETQLLPYMNLSQHNALISLIFWRSSIRVNLSHLMSTIGPRINYTLMGVSWVRKIH